MCVLVPFLPAIVGIGKRVVVVDPGSPENSTIPEFGGRPGKLAMIYEERPWWRFCASTSGGDAIELSKPRHYVRCRFSTSLPIVWPPGIVRTLDLVQRIYL